MWTPLITLIALVLLALITAAGMIALTATDQERGQRALSLLKVVLGASLGTSGVLALIIRLHQAGLL